MINKKGLSGVVTVVILIALSVALVAVVWAVVQNMVESNLNKASSCSSLFGENVIEINNDYTCYKKDSSIYFSINVGNVDVEAILVKIEGSLTTKTYKLDSESSFDNLKTFNEGPARIPDKNSGTTYNLSVSEEGLIEPYSIGISPIISGTTCSEIDKISKVDDCVLLVDFPQ